jgi:hypothetical protein
MKTYTVALMWHGDRAERDSADLAAHRLGPTADAMRAEGLEPVACVYSDEAAADVRAQLAAVDAVQVWVNPIERGQNRAMLDALLRDVARAGVLVSTHPDTILKIGAKDVLFKTRHMAWGGDVRLYASADEMRAGLPGALRSGPRVLKQYRGHSGMGVWKVSGLPDPARVRVRHAPRGNVEHETALADWIDGCAPYFAEGPMIDQPFQSRIGDGMVRLYLVRDRVAGFGHQAVNALVPAAPGAPPEDAPQAGPRLYYPPDLPQFQPLKDLMETRWLPELMRVCDVADDALPMLWDADFMFGPKTPDGADTYVLCEINVSSVYPYPESAKTPLARAIKSELARRRGG